MTDVVRGAWCVRYGGMRCSVWDGVRWWGVFRCRFLVRASSSAFAGLRRDEPRLLREKMFFKNFFIYWKAF